MPLFHTHWVKMLFQEDRGRGDEAVWRDDVRESHPPVGFMAAQIKRKLYAHKPLYAYMSGD